MPKNFDATPDGIFGKDLLEYSVGDDQSSEYGESQIKEFTQESEALFRGRSKKERYLIIAFAFFAVAVLGLGVMQFMSRRIMTWEDVFGSAPSGVSETIGQSASSSDIENLMALDTDKDGLSDYDELNTYGTSAYLEDTDSDGILDRVEIASGSNPLCSKGSACESSSTELQKSATSLDIDEYIPEAEDPSKDTESLDDMLLAGKMSAANLRAMLQEGGIDANYLSQLDDKTLMELYEKALGQAVPENAKNLIDSDTTNDYSQFENLTPQQVRKLMLDNGMDPTIVNKLSDSQIEELYKETLQQLTR